MSLRESRQEISRRSVVPESLAGVCVQIDVPGTEDKAPAQLKGIPAQAMLAVPRCSGSCASYCVLMAQEMTKGCASETRRTIRLSLVVNQEREGDPTFNAESLGVGQVTQPDGGQPRTLFPERLLVIAQLRDVLAAEDSAVVPKEYDDRRSTGP